TLGACRGDERTAKKQEARQENTRRRRAPAAAYATDASRRCLLPAARARVDFGQLRSVEAERFRERSVEGYIFDEPRAAVRREIGALEEVVREVGDLDAAQPSGFPEVVEVEVRAFEVARPVFGRAHEQAVAQREPVADQATEVRKGADPPLPLIGGWRVV